MVEDARDCSSPFHRWARQGHRTTEVLRRVRFRRTEADQRGAANAVCRLVASARVAVDRRRSVVDPPHMKDADRRLQGVLECGVRSRAVASLRSHTEAPSSQVTS